MCRKQHGKSKPTSPFYDGRHGNRILFETEYPVKKMKVQ